MARRIKVFLDANTIISAFLFEGVYRQALRLAIENNHYLITSEYVLDEVNEVLQSKFPARRIEVMYTLSLMELKVLPVPSKQDCAKFIAVLRDPKDVPVLTSAVQANADLILTGDRDFFTEKLKNIIQVINATTFLKRFNNF